MDQADVEQYFTWLDELRASGTTNMMSARPLLVRRFGLDRKDSHWVHGAWMRSFNPMEPVRKRAHWALRIKETANA